MLDLIFIAIYLTISLLGVGFFLFELLVGKFDFSEKWAEALFATFFFFNLVFVCWFWNALFEAYWNGRTLGKAIMGLRTLTVDGGPIGLGSALLRNVLRYADLFLGPFGVLVMGTNDRMARLGDLAAGTMVVVDRKKFRDKTTLAFKEPIVLNIEAKIPEDFEISPALHKTLALYVSRRLEISPFRRYEIAAPLANILSKKAGISYRIEPDAFLCALYQRSLGLDRHI